MKRKYSFTLLCVFIFIAFAPAIAMKGAHNTPISINADDLELLQQERKAIFTGGVEAQQGGMRLFSNKMTVYYKAKEGQPQNTAAMGGLERIEVLGNVRLHTETEKASAQRGIYDADKSKLFLYDNVVLRRGENVLNGSILEYNLTTGASVLKGGASGTIPKSSGRVRAIFTPAQEE